MVFVTLGTQKQQFIRLLNKIENSELLKYEEIIVQAGHTAYKTNKIKIIDFLTKEQLENYISQSEFIITHGGVGSIFTAILLGKKVLAIPRLKKNKEHIDDHQIEICYKLKELGYIDVLDDDDEIDNKINFIRNNEFKKYIPDISYLNKIEKVINEL